MRLHKGNMWSTGADMIVVTCNAALRRDGAVVMGRGAALEAKTMYPKCPYTFGGLIRAHIVQRGRSTPYGMLISPYHENPKLAIFQVKRHFSDAAQLDLIKNSVEHLLYYAVHHWDEIIALNFPGIGNGRRRRDEVLPLLEKLPDNVWVCEMQNGLRL